LDVSYQNIPLYFDDLTSIEPKRPLLTMSKLSFKAYLVKEDSCSTEVRRFGVDADVATNFMYLREKLQTIFPDLRGKSFIVTWKGEFCFFFFPRLVEEFNSEAADVSNRHCLSKVLHII